MSLKAREIGGLVLRTTWYAFVAVACALACSRLGWVSLAVIACAGIWRAVQAAGDLVLTLLEWGEP